MSDRSKDQLPGTPHELTKQCQNLDRKMDLALEKIKKRDNKKKYTDRQIILDD